MVSGHSPRPEGLNVPQAIWPLSDRGLAARLIDLATLRFLEGAQPYARQAFFADVHSIDDLAPEGAVLARELTHDNGDCQRLLLGDGWSLHLVLTTRRPEVQVMVTATTAELADEVIGTGRRSVPPGAGEDAGGLDRAGARVFAGARMGRLLNVFDVILGSGLRVLLRFTTNEPMR